MTARERSAQSLTPTVNSLFPGMAKASTSKNDLDFEKWFRISYRGKVPSM